MNNLPYILLGILIGTPIGVVIGVLLVRAGYIKDNGNVRQTSC